MNIVDLDDESEGVQVYYAPKTVFKEILTYFTDPEWGDLTDVRKGFDIKIKRVGRDRNTEYTVTTARRPSRLANKSLLENLYDLESLYTFASYEEQCTIWGGGSNTKSKKVKKKVSSSKRSNRVPKEEDDDATEERPRRKKTSRDVSNADIKNLESQVRRRKKQRRS